MEMGAELLRINLEGLLSFGGNHLFALEEGGGPDGGLNGQSGQFRNFLAGEGDFRAELLRKRQQDLYHTLLCRVIGVATTDPLHLPQATAEGGKGLLGKGGVLCHQLRKELGGDTDNLTFRFRHSGGRIGLPVQSGEAAKKLSSCHDAVRRNLPAGMKMLKVDPTFFDDPDMMGRGSLKEDRLPLLKVLFKAKPGDAADLFGGKGVKRTDRL